MEGERQEMAVLNPTSDIKRTSVYLAATWTGRREHTLQSEMQL